MQKKIRRRRRHGPRTTGGGGGLGGSHTRTGPGRPPVVVILDNAPSDDSQGPRALAHSASFHHIGRRTNACTCTHQPATGIECRTPLNDKSAATTTFARASQGCGPAGGAAHAAQSSQHRGALPVGPQWRRAPTRSRDVPLLSTFPPFTFVQQPIFFLVVACQRGWRTLPSSKARRERVESYTSIGQHSRRPRGSTGWCCPVPPMGSILRALPPGNARGTGGSPIHCSRCSRVVVVHRFEKLGVAAPWALLQRGRRARSAISL